MQVDVFIQNQRLINKEAYSQPDNEAHNYPPLTYLRLIKV